MNSLWLWIGIAIVVIVLIILLVVIGKKRGDAKKVSFDKPAEEEPKQLTQEQKSGNYQAKSGFNFAPAGGAKEAQKAPVQADKPAQAQQAAKAEPNAAEPNATDIANEQLSGKTSQPKEKPQAQAKPQADKPQSAQPTADAAANKPVADKPVAEKPVAEEPETKPAQQQRKPAKTDKPAEPTKQAQAQAPAEEKKQAAESSADKADKPQSKGTGAAAAAAAGAAGVAGAAAGASESEESHADRAPEAAGQPEAAPKPEEPAAAEKAETPEDVVSVENAEVAEESPVFDEVVEDNDAEDIEERVDDREEAEEAAAAAEAQTGAAEAAKEQTEVPEGEPAPAPAPQDDIAPAGGRLGRLRGRLSRSQNAIGQGLMGILSAGDLDEDAWEEVEDTLIMADLGTKSTMKVTDSLREKIAERGVSSEDEARAMLRECLIEAGHPEMDRSIKAMPNEGKPAIVMVVGVNGTGKTTTTGKLARVLVAMGHKVLLGAADTFRAAAADQLETWGRRVGADTVRGKEGADPASVAFDAVATGVEQQVDVVLVDTAGRLHTSTDLMDQLGKVKRVVEKKTDVDEVLLVLDATVGQNGLTQARIFREVVDITGVVLTKLDGTAKGGIVFQVQEELGVPVKLVGLGEGADDLAPFEVEGFVDALLGEK
ncbi:MULTISPECIES: signal recognition particle-docking protein FtsY [Corynebacterium]|uniref:signal recognition particle-docking protein FtsY n=1 Tax=Corynebacterium TaxID=1716 RepID=UPI001EF290AE|nr:MULTISPECIES: signal recognition particle-docking protein FtsY [Corynebacterium]MCG7440536.1 signal recognition particle-docking protein FtsY [Corynebacterium sp. ACRPQ]MCG7460744.1 signal recognition particle-docking protein FtsY [Corynebacterium sp. ACRPF]MCG7464409.1 signal recognition particle-docking protein FtsY [Corynebacterium sp. ACRPJ]MDV2416076.1 signal recognition particle-docking protein FtsY [Corynebacterium tuberculostearicum]MDV2436107.1 signal recognition particle-docking p